ncbi:carbohydrate sulfotransferase 1-like [Pecten maximus]|uniref:carbohydrate sulfotransferase 1-like n=1 Tax=Pecten maximus TaxID=6579 RepID=UPI0014580F53|nr:carbohydrate sulfotransferase 1-like [Pecten maximus]
MLKRLRNVHVVFWTIFIVLPIIFIFARSVVLLSTPARHKIRKLTNFPNVAKQALHVQHPKVKTEADIMIVGYIRGGSTFLGELMGIRKDSFYLYEPLYRLSKLGYYKPGYHCNTMDTYCTGAMKMDMHALGFLKSIYSCDFRLMEGKISLWSFAKGRGDFNWTKSLTDCNGQFQNCFNKQIRRCVSATSIVTKVVRVTVGLVGRMLHKYPNLKIVHLMRDPRAVINSRMEIWPSNTKNILESARSLCRKMKEDFMDSKRLLIQNPNRVRTVFYEDLAMDPITVTKDLYKFANYSFTADDEIRIRQMTESDLTVEKAQRKWSLFKPNSSDTARQWRLTIPPSVSLLTGLGCSEIYDMARYPELKTKDDLRNSSIPLRLPISSKSLLHDYLSHNG